jgi:hypothetical protein
LEGTIKPGFCSNAEIRLFLFYDERRKTMRKPNSCEEVNRRPESINPAMAM